MQKFEAQGAIVKGKQQSVRVYCENLQNNSDSLRSNFSGTAFPEAPVIGQHCYREDNNIEYIYTAHGWEEVGGAQGEIVKELNDARGDHKDLAARLDVALNPDGTLKGDAEVNLNEWKTISDVATFVDHQTFSMNGNYEALFTKYRAVKINDNTVDRVSFVENSKYDTLSKVTTVKLRDAIVNETIKALHVGVIQTSLPSNVALKSDMKANQPATTGFKSHVASGLDIEINAEDGCARVNKGRAYVDGTYEDLDEDVVLNLDSGIEEGKHLVYAHKKTDGGLEIKTKRFESPVTYDQIKNIPQKDVLFMTDWAVRDDEDARNMIQDKSGNGCHLQPKGTVSNIVARTPVSWKVPYHIDNASDICWQSTGGAFKGLPANRPWSIMHAFIPHMGYVDGDTIPFILSMGGSIAQISFRLVSYEALTDTYVAALYINAPVFGTGAAATWDVRDAIAYPMRIRRNEPCVLTLEYDGAILYYYINGRIIMNREVPNGFSSFTAGTIEINDAGNAGTYRINATSLFTCIRAGYWGQKEIAEICNQIGVPSEHVGFNMKTPRLFHGIANGEYSDGAHAWMMNETSGNVVYDLNKNNPLNGVTSNMVKVNTTVKDGQTPSLNTVHKGAIEFDRVSIDNNKGFSFFAYMTLRDGGADATIASNYPSDASGFILGLTGYGLRCHIGKVWLGGNHKVSTQTPVLVGVVIDKDHVKLYADSMEPEFCHISDYTGLTNNNRLVFGYYGANSGQIHNSEYHAAVMADRAFTDAEIRQLFKDFKNQEYKHVPDDNHISSNDAVLGMIKVNERAEVEKIETYPRWGRRKNPFGNQKYFLGWYTVSCPATAKTFNRYYLPNLTGSSRMRINLYAKNLGSPGNRGEMTTLPAMGVEMWNDRTTLVNMISETYLNQDYIHLAVQYSPLMGSVASNPYQLGIELEPIADDNDLDNLNYGHY